MSCSLIVPQPWFEEIFSELSLGMSAATAVEHGGGFCEGNDSGVISRMKTNPIYYMSSVCLLLSCFLVQRLDLLIMKLS